MSPTAKKERRKRKKKVCLFSTKATKGEEKKKNSKLEQVLIVQQEWHICLQLALVPLQILSKQFKKREREIRKKKKQKKILKVDLFLFSCFFSFLYQKNFFFKIRWKKREKINNTFIWCIKKWKKIVLSARIYNIFFAKGGKDTIE